MCHTASPRIGATHWQVTLSTHSDAVSHQSEPQGSLVDSAQTHCHVYTAHVDDGCVMPNVSISRCPVLHAASNSRQSVDGPWPTLAKHVPTVLCTAASGHSAEDRLYVPRGWPGGRTAAVAARSAAGNMVGKMSGCNFGCLVRVA